MHIKVDRINLQRNESQPVKYTDGQPWHHPKDDEMVVSPLSRTHAVTVKTISWSAGIRSEYAI
jgi:hypothetical protein